jgi:membrane-bound lytic murein transglycosylase D
MNKKRTLSLVFALFSFAAFAQENAEADIQIKPIVKISFLDSIKSTFTRNSEMTCVDSLWMKELANQDLFEAMQDDIKRINPDEEVAYGLSTELLKERLEKLDAKSPFNIEYSKGLENIIKSYLKNRPRSYERLMAISEYYFPMFEEHLAKYNVPLEIKYLAVIESALNPRAKSRVGAAGLWQFMYPTGKQYNLEVNSYVDESSDPLLVQPV